MVPVLAGATAGSTVMVWVDGSGRLTDLPLQHSQVRAQAILAALLAAMMLGLLLGAVGLLAPQGTGPAADGRLGCRMAGDRATVERAPLNLGFNLGRPTVGKFRSATRRGQPRG
jgi:hypothetical protein